jgi:hypothetical protein
LDKLGLNAIKTSSQWHGINKYSYSNSSNDDNDGHGIFNAIFVNNNSTSESDIRNQYDLAQYIQILLKSAQEKDILTLFVRPDSEIETNNWVDTVSHFPMHTIESTDEEKTHNAISFTARSNETIGPLKLKSIKLHTLEEAMSYPTSTGMGLETLLKLPTKPLREINQHIISTAKMMDLQFVNVSEGNTSHPHQGALDENGNPGYIHDEKALHKNPPPLTFTKEQVQCDISRGAMKDGNYKMLTEKVFVDLAAHEHAESLAKSGIKPRPKLFCLVYTIEKITTVSLPFERLGGTNAMDSWLDLRRLMKRLVQSIYLTKDQNSMTIFGKRSVPCGATFMTITMKNMIGFTLEETICTCWWRTCVYIWNLRKFNLQPMEVNSSLQVPVPVLKNHQSSYHYT